MSYAHQAWIPPIPPPKDHVYSQQGWPYPVAPAHAYAQPSRTRLQGQDYWDTELKDNPLGLENMHIRAENIGHEKRASSQPPSVQPIIPSSTTRAGTLPYPIAREPSSGKGLYSDNDLSADKIGLQHAGRDEGPEVIVYSPRRSHSSTAHREHDHISCRRTTEPGPGYDLVYGDPVNSIDRHTSMSARVSSSRSQTLPMNRRETSSAQAVQRSHTLPVDALYARDTSRSPAPRRSSERYENRYEYDDDNDEDYVYLSVHQPEVTVPKKGKKGSDRIKAWIEETREAGSGGTIGLDEPQTRRIVNEYERILKDSAPRNGRQDQSSERDRALQYQTIPPVSSKSNPVYVNNGVVGVSEEPEEMGARRLIRDEESLSSDNESRGSRDARISDRKVYNLYLPQRDSLRVDDGTGTQPVHLPSPRSLHKSSRASSTRNSYEQDYLDRERDREPERDYPRRMKSKSPRSKGHLNSLSTGQAHGMSSASTAANDYQHQTYTTPPITPTRPEDSRSPYIPSAAHERSPNHQTPLRPAYMYRGTNTSPSPHVRSSSSVTPSSVPRSITAKHLSQSQYGYGEQVSSPAKTKKQSPRASRSPSPRVTGYSTSSNYYANVASQASTPSRPHTHPQSQPIASRESISQGHVHSSSSQAQFQAHEGRRIGRTSSRAAGTGISSVSTAAAALKDSRNVRSGYWNRRGDYLTETGFVVLCPPERCYPRDLAEYPDTEFQDHFGNIAKGTPDMYPILPESIPKGPGRPAERKYESFIKYVMVTQG